MNIVILEVKKIRKININLKETNFNDFDSFVKFFERSIFDIKPVRLESILNCYEQISALF